MATATDLEPRLVARGKARRRTRLATTLTVFVLLVLVGAGTWLLLGTSVLGVRTITVSGTHRLDPATVREVAAVPGGEPLATLDVGAIASRLQELPVVRTVEVERQWPRTVSIVVHERVPAAVQQRGTTYALVDRTGVEIDQVERRPRALPLVSAPVDAGAPARAAALDVLDVLPPAVATDVRSVRAATPDDVRLQLSKGRTVVWGSAERSARKAAVLAVLLSRKASVYDVSAPDAPTTTK